MINTLGLGLSVVVRADDTLADEWMAFSAWYSVAHTLPDAKIYLVRTRRPQAYEIFHWPARVGLPVTTVNPPPAGADPLRWAGSKAFPHFAITTPVLVIDSGVLAVRGPDDVLPLLATTACGQSVAPGALYIRDPHSLTLAAAAIPGLCSPAKDDDLPAFSTCREGCGQFVFEEWIDRKDCPFSQTKRLAGSLSLTANEVQVLRMWAGMNVAFSTLSRR